MSKNIYAKALQLKLFKQRVVMPKKGKGSYSRKKASRHALD
jgi:hypothetical protein